MTTMIRYRCETCGQGVTLYVEPSEAPTCSHRRSAVRKARAMTEIARR